MGCLKSLDSRIFLVICFKFIRSIQVLIIAKALVFSFRDAIGAALGSNPSNLYYSNNNLLAKIGKEK